MTASVDTIPGWDQLRHGGLLFDGARLSELSKHAPTTLLSESTQQQLRQRANSIADDDADVSAFVTFILERVCGLDSETGTWLRGSNIDTSWGRRAITGENVKPRQLWQGEHDATLPVFIDDNKRIGIGRGRRTISQVLGWLRAGDEHIALITNGRQWRLLFAGLDYDAWCEWDLDLWFEEGELSSQVTALRLLVSAKLFTPESEDAEFPLLQAIRDTRKGQADLSEALGERVREAVEILIQSHGDALKKHCDSVPPEDIYRAACRTAMRLVVILFAESRDLLPRDNALYHGSYGLNGLFEHLEREAARGAALKNNISAWPRVLALFNLVLQGSHHPDLPITAYGGELFAKGAQDAESGVSRSLYVFENACFENEGAQISDLHVHEMLKLLTRTKVRIRSGRSTTSTVVPVDFSDLSSEYIGILYEGLLDYELKTVPPNETVVFLSRGDRPALPLSRLEDMGDAALRTLFKSFKQSSSHQEDDLQGDEPLAKEVDSETEAHDLFSENDGKPADDVEQATDTHDERHRSQTRAEQWAHRVVEVMKLVKKQGRDTPEKRLVRERKAAAEAKRLVDRVVLSGEQYLVRWGGTRKGSGSFYTRPGLAVPTVQRTLRPLAYDPPQDVDGEPDRTAHAAQWTPKLPEQILDIKVCDPACGSGTFPLAALRFLTDALYASLQYHQRIEPDGERSLVRLLGIRNGDASEDSGQSRLTEERIPCPPDADDFESRLKAVLRRHVVERCIYAVDLDPLAVELCRLSLWIETMNRNLPFGFLDHKVKCGNALIGAWFDQFRHYPVMAWKNRDGGDKDHTNGVYFEKKARTEVIKEFVKERLRPDLELFLRQDDLLQDGQLEAALSTHDDALKVLSDMHDMHVRNAEDADEQARMYREEFLGSPAWLSVKTAMDLWCACWFWPVDKVDLAPLPSNFAEPPDETRTVAAQVAGDMRFFHWELEFPDVFREHQSGFHAILGNPPWDVPKPVSKEFFSNIDPLYRTYGKQEALRHQTQYFTDQENNTELRWLDYIADFRAQSNFVGYVRNPFGDLPKNVQGPGRFTISRGGKGNKSLHDRWRRVRNRSSGYCDPAHPFRHQGSADLNLYKMFLEAAHALLQREGRLGFIVPSGLYSDDGTKGLRTLFFEHCGWEWLFGIENRNGIFPIHKNYKFNPVIVEKGGTTSAVRTAFMRRNLADWEHAEEFSIPYSKELADRFSPSNHTFVEIQSRRDLEILEKIYANGVLLGDEGPNSWGIRYSAEFHMTNDSHLFPPRDQWEAKGYRPDEYSRWLQGDWRPVEELWESLGIDSTQAEPAGAELEEWLFDTTASPERREAEARYVHGHLLKLGDVARTDYDLRCAQPPYDLLPIPRSRVPTGVIFSREGDAWIHEDDIEDTALPIYQGKMMYVGKWTTSATQFSESGRRDLQPEFLLAKSDLRHYSRSNGRIIFRDISNATNERSFVATLVPGYLPCGNKTPIIMPPLADPIEYLKLAGILTSTIFDWSVRQRMSGTTLNRHIVESLAVPFSHSIVSKLSPYLAQLLLDGAPFASDWLQFSEMDRLHYPRMCTNQERLRINAILNAVMAATMGLSISDMRYILRDCDYPCGDVKGDQPKGFWRIDKNKEPELRETVLSLIAFYDLEENIKAANDVSEGIDTFLDQNHGEGWMLPETLCLADYDLGHDDRAKSPQLVAGSLGPRFYDWQLLQSPEEAWQEYHLHARNLLGIYRYTERTFELVRQRVANGEEGIDLLINPFVQDLMGRESLLFSLQRPSVRKFLNEKNFSNLLDQLKSQGVLDEDGYSALLAQDFPPTHDEDLPQVAEPHADYQVGPDDRHNDLFKKP